MQVQRYVGRHRSTDAQRMNRRTIARLAVVAVASTAAAVPLTGSAGATSSLSCLAFTDAAQCASFSHLLTDVMETVAPAGSAAFASQLAAGYRLNDSKTVVCVLAVSCDAWPVAVTAADTVVGSGTCGLDSADVCRAITSAVSGQSAQAAAMELAAVLPKVAGSPVNDRNPRLAMELSSLFGRLTEVPGGQQIADTVVGVVALAIYLIPATSPGSVIPPGTVPSTVEVNLGEAVGDEATCLNDSLVSASVATDTPALCIDDPLGVPKKKRCVARFNTFNTLETQESSSFTKFVIEALAGISDRRWADPSVDHRGDVGDEQSRTGIQLPVRRGHSQLCASCW